jgi:tetratricopeptide (TPR) repeat protein
MDATAADQLFAQGLERHRAGLLEQALALYERALALAPRHFDALHHIGIVAWQSAQHALALQFLEAALEVDGAVAAAWSNLGNVQQALARHPDAVDSYARALALDPDHVDAHYNRANALRQLGRLEDALRGYDQALARAPGDAEAHNNRAVVLGELRQFEAGLAAADAALALRPDYAEAHNNRGDLLGQLERHEAALASFDRAIGCRPHFADAHVNRAKALKELGRLAPALESIEHALALQPGHAAAHWNRALWCLQDGRFEQGWRGYEWRWQAAHLSIAGERRQFAAPLWLGREALAGRTLLLHAEQGLGDTLQMCRYTALAAARGATVILEVQPALAGLLAGLDGVSRVVARGDALPRFDLHCPLMSLPLAFGTTLATIPAAPAYLAAAPASVAQWAAWLGPATRRRVGLVWSGNPRHHNDHQRSIGFDQLAPLFGVDCQFVALQPDVAGPGLARPGLARPGLAAPGALLRDFRDTAALCALMDVVITVDTSVAHLAGALGKPVWILLPRSADWRWLLGRGDSPWYPSARLYRQRRAGDWSEVLAAVAADLARLTHSI